MIDFALTTSDGDVLRRHVEDMRARLADLKPLADRIASVLFIQNREARASGLDKNGNPFDPIRESTVQRRRRRGDGDGPPLSPNYGASRVQNPVVAVEAVSDKRYTVTLSWPDMPFLKYHVTGTPVMAARDPVGITPRGRELIADAVRDFVEGAIRP